MRVHAVGSLNGANAVRVLSECGADLGIVLGTRILKPGTFGVPRMGCINLHKGRVPEYRACRLGFGSFTMGVVGRPHRALCRRGFGYWRYRCHQYSTHYGDRHAESLVEKLHEEGARLLASVVSTIRSGKASPQPREKLPLKPGPGPPEKRSVCFGGVYLIGNTGATFRRFCEICIFCLSTTVASTTSPANFTVCCGGQEVRFTPTIESTIIRRMS